MTDTAADANYKIDELMTDIQPCCTDKNLSAENPKSVLVVNLRYFGDALISASMIHRMRKAWPEAHIAWLVYRHVAPVLEGIEGIDEVITVDAHPSRIKELGTLRRFWNRFDMAFVTQPSSHPVVYGWAASKKCVGFNKSHGFGRFWKELLFYKSVPEGGASVLQSFDRLLDVAGLPVVTEWTVPAPTSSQSLPGSVAEHLCPPYVVLHPKSRCAYKDWSVEKWQKLIALFNARGVQCVISGGPGEKEKTYADSLITEGAKAINVAGVMSFGQTADLIRGSVGFIGPDTATTHVAAATGRPVVTLFGPTPISAWGPWAPGQSLHWDARCGDSGEQQRGRVVLIALRPYDRCPCGLKGCANHDDAVSDCIMNITPERVMESFDRATAEPGK